MMKQTSDPRKRTENLFLAVSALLVFFITTASPTDNDMWWHLRAGKEIWEGGKILLADTFSYTQYGAPWVNAFWLSDLGLYGVWKIGSFFAITITVALIAVALMAIIALQMEGSVYLRGLLLLLAMSGAVANWTARPQLLSFLLLAILDYFLCRHLYVKRQPLWLLIILFAAWGNIHGGFIWGILILCATILGEIVNQLFGDQSRLQWREIGNLSLWSMGAGLAILLNPNGIMLWQLPFRQVEVSLSIQEWLSPDFHRFYAHPALWLLFLWIMASSYSKSQSSFVDLIKGLGFTYLFFFAQRNVGPYLIIVTPIVMRAMVPALNAFEETPLIQKLKNSLATSKTSRPLPDKFTIFLNISIVSLFTVFVLMRAYVVSLPAWIDLGTPSKAVQWIRDNKPPGPIFNSYNWGGYLIWSLPEYPVFIDGRADLYGRSLVTEWKEIANGTDRGYRALNRREINLVFLEPAWPLTKNLSEHGWRLFYEDDKVVIFGR